MKKIIVLTIIYLLSLIIFNLELTAGAIARIGDPIVLPGVEHKILILEYDNPVATTWGKDISQIIAHEILGTMTGVRSVGVVNLHQRQERIEYTPENIERIAKEQEALIVIWGEFYTDDKNIYLHSHLRLIPREKFPASGFGLTFEYGSEIMKANPPTLQVNFVPIKISIETLNKLHSFYNQTITMHNRPSEDSLSVGVLKPGDTYYVIDRKGDWTKIKVSGRSPGWIRHSTLGVQNELAEVQAVLKFAQGTLQFIAGNYRFAENSLTNYLENFGKEQNNMNIAFSHILLGLAKIRGERYKDEIPENENVSIEFEKAASLIPNNASPINYLTIVYLLKYMHNNFAAPELLDLEQHLILVIKSENDLQSIRNLRILYLIALQHNLLWDRESSLDDYKYKINQNIYLLDEIESQWE